MQRFITMGHFDSDGLIALIVTANTEIEACVLFEKSLKSKHDCGTSSVDVYIDFCQELEAFKQSALSHKSGVTDSAFAPLFLIAHADCNGVYVRGVRAHIEKKACMTANESCGKDTTLEFVSLVHQLRVI